MKSSRITFSLIVLLASQLILVSCGDKPEEPPPTIRKPAIPSVPAAKKVEQKASEEAVTDYSLTKDMRNPFRTYIVLKRPKIVDDGHIKTPLECCDINLFKVSVVISGIENPRALVLAPDGKRYAVKIGDRIGVKEGKIVEIEGKSIIVEEILRDEEGNVATTDRVELGLPDKDGEKQKMGGRARGFGRK